MSKYYCPPRRLADGTLGYWVEKNRADDCLRAALATCLQVAPEDVPDPRLDDRRDQGWSVERVEFYAREELAEWLDGRGLRKVVHRRPPTWRRRWIGVICRSGVFSDHCLVMSRGELLHDPAAWIGAGSATSRLPPHH